MRRELIGSLVVGVLAGVVIVLLLLLGVSLALGGAQDQGVVQVIGVHRRVAAQVKVYACGVRGNDVAEWQEMAASAQTSLVIEDHFDECVLGALTQGGWRLLPAR